ncbi:Dabb family protein [Pseudarthrobacter equi]|uniref:Dabb family protein n=1 Tax=Pseudarthrobacter equi TaxID=728066 RepID=UPI0021C104D2|nr:Dabb family protein [Pseudarthrobacter equi]MCT9627186.1 Dabb family protein [Pseudarthrobacter equi]
MTKRYQANSRTYDKRRCSKTEVSLTSSAYEPGTIRHIVLFRYRDDLDGNDLQRIEQKFHELQTSRRDGHPYILGIESGAQNSPEGLGQGFHHAYIVSFASQGDRNYYVGEPLITNPALYDPVHHAFKSFIAPYISDQERSVLVFDFHVPAQQ